MSEEIAWNKADDDLKVKVLEWAENNIQIQRNWILELFSQNICSCKTLEKFARNDEAFRALCATVSIGLRVNLRSWFKITYPDSTNFFL